jgi:hypothetical protein
VEAVCIEENEVSVLGDEVVVLDLECLETVRLCDAQWSIFEEVRMWSFVLESIVDGLWKDGQKEGSRTVGIVRNSNGLWS